MEYLPTSEIFTVHDNGQPLIDFSYEKGPDRVPAYHCGRRGYARANFAGAKGCDYLVVLKSNTEIIHCAFESFAYTNDFVCIEVINDDVFIEDVYNWLASGGHYEVKKTDLEPVSYYPYITLQESGWAPDSFKSSKVLSKKIYLHANIKYDILTPTRVSFYVGDAKIIITSRGVKIHYPHEKIYIDTDHSCVYFWDMMHDIDEGLERLEMYYGIKNLYGQTNSAIANVFLSAAHNQARGIGHYSDLFYQILPRPIAEEVDHFYGRIVCFVG
jgi:hypothetical protein